MARGVWTGSITFGLVSVGVKALTAVRDHDIHFHQIEKGTGSRIGNQKISKESGEPVESDDIELGYEISSGHHVVFDPKEVDELRPRSTRVLAVTDFVDLASIDPVFFERTYWLAPTDEGAAHAYRLLAAAMEQSQQVGIGSVVMRNKQYLTAVRPMRGALAMSTLRFADEVVDIDDLDEIPQDGDAPTKKEMALAMQIIDSLATEWDPTRYEDTFTDELIGLIEAKAAGDEVVAEPLDEEEAGGKVVDLMAALQASVDAAKKGRSTSGSSSAKKAPAKKAAKEASAKKGAGAKKAPARKSPAKKPSAKGSSAKQRSSASSRTRKSA
jgi:DNA end-binding protein Ku